MTVRLVTGPGVWLAWRVLMMWRRWSWTCLMLTQMSAVSSCAPSVLVRWSRQPGYGSVWRGIFCVDPAGDIQT